MSPAAAGRAALDYWEHLNLSVHQNFDDLRSHLRVEDPARGDAWSPSLARHGGRPRFFLVTKHGTRNYYDARFSAGDALIFGSETEGIPSDILDAFRDQTIRIPMLNPSVRCLNLADSVAIVLSEAMRQIGYGMRA